MWLNQSCVCSQAKPHWEVFFPQDTWDAQLCRVQRSGAVTIPGNAQKPCGWGPWGHNLVENTLVVLRWGLDLRISEVFPNINDSTEQHQPPRAQQGRKEERKGVAVFQKSGFIPGCGRMIISVHPTCTSYQSGWITELNYVQLLFCTNLLLTMFGWYLFVGAFEEGLLSMWIWVFIMEMNVFIL